MQSEPLHADKHRSTFNLTLIFAVVVAVIGLIGLSQGGGAGSFILFVVGGAMAAYSWFTSPSYYWVYNDRLIIAYGRPRVRHVLFQEIDDVELLTLPFGNRLLVRLRSRRRLFLHPTDTEQFQTSLAGALDSYRRANPEGWEPGQET